MIAPGPYTILDAAAAYDAGRDLAGHILRTEDAGDRKWLQFMESTAGEILFNTVLGAIDAVRAHKKSDLS